MMGRRYNRAKKAQGGRADREFGTDKLSTPNTAQKLADEHGVALHTCIAAAQRRGILDALVAKEAEKATFNVRPPFLLSGLGQLAEMLLTADRVIRF